VNVNGNHVSLQLNLKWLVNANVQGPLTLKNTYIAEAESSYPISRFDADIIVQHSYLQYDKNFDELMRLTGPLSITNDMKFGVKPIVQITNLTAGPNLILLHGYCAGENPFTKNTHIFTNAGFFLNKNANLGNDAFSKLVNTYAIGIGSQRYSLVGHSQGGLVSLHLLNYYWSGLDQITDNGRRIQTIGTPWQGCTAAGSAANLGKAFGVGCGANNDLTIDGTRNWFAGIHEDHPEQVYYYYTTYKLGNLFGDHCNMAINMILQWPNDGTSEEKYINLAGGNNMGRTQGQCHTTGMKYNAAYWDNTRNTIFNNNAARH